MVPSLKPESGRSMGSPIRRGTGRATGPRAPPQSPRQVLGGGCPGGLCSGGLRGTQTLGQAPRDQREAPQHHSPKHGQSYRHAGGGWPALCQPAVRSPAAGPCPSPRPELTQRQEPVGLGLEPPPNQAWQPLPCLVSAHRSGEWVSCPYPSLSLIQQTSLSQHCASRCQEELAASVPSRRRRAGSHGAWERGRRPTRAGRGVCARLGLVTEERAERRTQGPPGETQPPSSCLDPGLETRGTGLNTQGHTRATCCQPPSALRVCPPCSTPKPGLALPVGEQVASRTRPLPTVQPRARPCPGSACISDPPSPAWCRPPLEGLLGPLLGASVAPARPHEAESCRPLCSPQEGAGPASAIVSKVLPAAPQEGVRQGSGGAQLGAVGGAITRRQKAARRRAPLTDTERRLEEEEENGCGEEMLRRPGGPGPPSTPGSETSAKLAPAVGPGRLRAPDTALACSGG